MSQFWNERYQKAEYAYGTEPNEYFKSIISTLSPGSILIPGAGEGRDAVYAARLGWKVHAFDQSAAGKKKALALAEQFGKLSLQFDVCDAQDFDTDEKYDLIALIYFHLPLPFRKTFHSKMQSLLRKGGHLVLEAFSPKQLRNTSGGPKEADLLLTPSMLEEEFAGLKILENVERTIQLNEGLHHVGQADVTRFHGIRE